MENIVEQKEVRLVYLHETTMLSIHFYFENHLFCITISEMLYFICTLREKFVIYSNSTQYVAGYCTIGCPVFDLIDELINENCVGEGNIWCNVSCF